MLQQITAILLVLGLLLGTLVVLRRKGLAQFSPALQRGAAKAKQMQVLERMPLTPQHSLHLVAIKSQTFLIGVSPSGINQIASLGGPEDQAR